MLNKQIKRGDVYWVDFGTTKGSEQGGVRPAVVIQNDIGNKFSPTVIVCPISSEIKKKELPTHVLISDYHKYGLKQLSQVMTEQMKVRDKTQLGDYIGTMDTQIMSKIDRAIEISVNVGSAKNTIDSREVKTIKVKVEKIKILDSFLETWFSQKSDIDTVKGFLQERADRIEDLERFAKYCNLDYKEYYSPMIYNDLNRMVV